MPYKETLLGEVPFFQLLDGDERAALGAMLTEVRGRPDEVLFENGDPGDAMYVVCSGAVELSTTDKLGQRMMLTVARRGDIFGELSLLDEGPRTARALVLEPAEMLMLRRNELLQFLRSRPDAALDLMAVMGRRMRATTDRLRQMATRNINEEMQQPRTPVERITDWIAAFSGSFAFLVIHALVFAGWIGWNYIPDLSAFDPFPFGLLTMCVSLEAIFLSVIVLLSQNRQAAKDRVRSDVEYDVNLKAELEVSHLHEKVDRLHGMLLSRLQRIESGLPRS